MTSFGKISAMLLNYAGQSKSEYSLVCSLCNIIYNNSIIAEYVTMCSYLWQKFPHTLELYDESYKEKEGGEGFLTKENL